MNTLALPPTASTTLVILLGASAWPNSPGFQASRAFVRAARGFRDYLLDPHSFGLPAANLFDLFDALASASDQLEMLGSFLEQRTQALKAANQAVRDVLVYFVGHGGFAGPSADFYLMPRRTNVSSLRASGMAIDALAEVLREKARQLRRYLFLDCCFAAAAFRVFQGGPDQTAIIKTLAAFHVQAKSSGFPSKGTVLLCSSDQKSPSLLLPDESCTMFSHALLDVLRNGDLHRPQQLSLRDLKELAEDRLVALPEKNVPRPGLYSPDQSEGDAADVPFFPNPRAQKERMRQIEEERRHQAEEAERARRMEEERQRRAEEERARQAEKERERKAREEQALQAREERRHPAEIERQRLTPNEVVSPSLSSPESAQSSNTAAAGHLLPLTSPPQYSLAQRIALAVAAVLLILGGGLTWLAYFYLSPSTKVTYAPTNGRGNTPPTPSPTPVIQTYSISLNASQGVPGLETGIQLTSGYRLTVKASGEATDGPETDPSHCYGNPINPDGVSSVNGSPCRHRIASSIYPSAPVGTLLASIGQVGTTSSTGWFIVGSSYSSTVTVSGQLYLIYNDAPRGYFDNNGSYQVTITVEKG